MKFTGFKFSLIKKAAWFQLFLFSSCYLLSQQYTPRYNNWYFGANAGLSFSTTPPTVLTNGQSNVLDYSSAISDANGNLLFYTDGMTVWNRNHVVMPNGSGLTGNTTAGQCGLIVPVPSDPNRYVIFHPTEFVNPGYLKYTVVDMSLAGGMGDVVALQKNVSLGSGWTEKLCAYYNPAGNNYWVLAHKWNSNEFVAFNVTASSIATQSVSTLIGTIHNSGSVNAPDDCMGELTISPDGQKVINAVTNQDIIDLFDFNLATGVLSNSISVAVANGGKVFGAAFSPDSKKIYVTGLLGTNLYQYDIANYNLPAINASKTTIATTSSGVLLYIELAPDRKLYISKWNNTSLAVINNPDLVGIACNFSLTGISLGSIQAKSGLCRIAYNIPDQLATGLMESGSDAAAIWVYPNPFNRMLKVNSNGADRIRIVNCLGDLVYEINGSVTKDEVDLGFLPAGVYFACMEKPDGLKVIKLLKD